MTIAQFGPAQDAADRHAAIERYGVLDSPTEAAFDAIVRLAAELLDAPVAAINLLARDRQWFQAEVGLGVRELPLNGAFCSTAILQDAMLVVPDATRDPRFAWFPVVTAAGGVRFYAGAMLRTPDGIPIGTLCVADTLPRPDGLTARQRLALRTLADQVMGQMELRRVQREKQTLALTLHARENELRERTREAHDARGRLEALLAAAPVGISYVDASGAQVLANAELERLWGDYPRASGVADFAAWRGWWADGSARHGQPVAIDEWPQARSLRGERVDGEIIEIEPFAAPGQRRTVMLRAAPVRGVGGAIEGSVVAAIDISARLASEQALRLNEARFRSLVLASAQIVWTTGSDGAGLGSAGWGDYTGQAPVAWAGEGWIDALHPDDRARTRAAWQAALAAGTPFECEYRVQTAAGDYRWMVARGRPILDRAGAVREWVGANTDIHDRRMAETAAHAWRARLESILEAGAIGTWTCDAAGVIDADANTAAMYGLTPDARFQQYLAAVHPDDLAAVRASLEAAKASGAPYQIVHRVRPAGPDGPELTVDSRGRIECDGSGAMLRASGVVIDISAQAAAEARLRASEHARIASEQRYRTVLSAIDVGFCIIEMLYDDAGDANDYRIVESNAAFARHTGLQDANGRTIRELVGTHDVRWSRLYGRVAATGLPVRIDQYSPNLDRWLDVYATRVGDPAARQVAVLLRDITEEKNRNDTLQHLADDLAEANRRQSEFLATLAHELRNPLAPVRTGLDLLRIGAGKPEVLERVRPMMERQVNHLVHLVDDLLDLARINSGKVELKCAEAVLKDVVLRAVEMVLPAVEAKRHDLRIDVAGIEQPPARVHADATRLAQVVGNVLTNAAKYTPAGGTIRLRAYRVGGQAHIEVADSGVGIARDDLPRLFDMFTQVGRHTEQEFGGLGIGLHLVRQMTELHGGRVHAESAGAGQGSTFVVELPLLAGDAGAVAPPQAAAPAPLSGLRILVADDNADAADLLREVLELHGHTVEVVGSGTAALDVAARTLPDLALLDIGMPGMSGLDVARRLRAAPASRAIRLVALSGWGTQEDRARSVDAGFEVHLTKPVELKALLELVRGGVYE
jgi:PAS domain S-box-containing protein